MRTEHLISGLWIAAADMTPGKAFGVAVQVAKALPNLMALLEQFDRLTHDVAKGQPVGVAVMLSGGDLGLLIEAVELAAVAAAMKDKKPAEVVLRRLLARLEALRERHG